MMEMRRARFRFASTEILSQYWRQLNAMSIMSWFRSKCCDFSLVKITMKDFIRASLSSLFDWANSAWACALGMKLCPDFI